MRHYGPRRLVIGILFCASACAMASASDSASSSTLSDLAWNQQAIALQLQRQVQPPVDPLHLTVSGASQLTAAFRVADWFEGNSIEAILAVPPGEITSASLTIESPAGAPDHPVSVKPIAFIRGHRLVKIQCGAMVASAEGSARITSGVLKLQYAAPVAAAAKPAGDAGRQTTGPVSEMVARLVANPADLPLFEVALEQVPPPRGDQGAAPPLGDATAGAVARFDMTTSGFVELRGADLAAAGIDISATPAGRISVWTEGRQVPVWALTATDLESPVKAADRFILLSEDNNSTYTATRSYWIKTDQPAQPMNRRTATGQSSPGGANPYFMATATVEEDVPPVLTKNDQFLSILDYRWVWWTWTPQGEKATGVPRPKGYDQPGQVRFDLPSLAAAPGTSASLVLNFYAHHWGVQSQPVPFEVTINGVSAGEAVVSDNAGLRHELAIPAGALKAAGNQLEIYPVVTSTSATMPDLCFDRLDVTYPSTYALTSSTMAFTAPASGEVAAQLQLPPGAFIADVTEKDPVILALQTQATTAPVIIPTGTAANKRFMAVTAAGVARAQIRPYSRRDNLRAQGNAGDVVVIAWPEFIDEMKPWVAAREQDGHQVRVVNVLDIYDQFGYGHLSPHAIREFLRHASTHWRGSAKGPAASTVVLVGDSTSAYRNEFRNHVINYVPTMRLWVNGDAFASDQWYACLFGDDFYADALIGRFSVNSVEDLRHTIAKQLDYRAKPAPGPWQNTLGFIADHSEFEDAVNRVIRQAVPPRFFLDRVLMSELPWVDNFYFPKEVADAQQAKVSPEATVRIRDMFNTGASVVTYFGHGSPNIWSTERMWFGGDSANSDNLMLTNRDKLSIVINMTCNSGAIDYPQPRWNVCISEDFMRVRNGGAVACFVPSGPGLTVQHERLMMKLGNGLFSGEPATLGQDAQLALWQYLADQNPPELARMYILLGDPLLQPHISGPADLKAEASAASVTAPTDKFVMLPPALAASAAPKAVQLHAFTDGAQPGPITTLKDQARVIAIPEDAADAPAAVAVSQGIPSGDGASSAPQASAFMPVDALSGVKMIQWRRTDSPAEDDREATLEFRLKNESPLPVRGFHLPVTRDGCSTCTPAVSPARDISGFQSDVITLKVSIDPGFNRFSVAMADALQSRPLEATQSVVVAGLRGDAPGGQSIPPAAVDPDSIEVRYRKNGDLLTATVSARVYVFAREPLSNLGIGLADPEGTVSPDSVVPITAVSPGAATPVSLSVTLADDATSEPYALDFDPSRYFPEFRRVPAQKVFLGKEGMADVAIVAIESSPASPSDGETVFFNVTLKNRGVSAADGVRVEAARVLKDESTEKVKSQVKLDPAPVSIAPGEEETVRLRWDPFQNAGENRLRFSANALYNAPDRNLADNTAEFTQHVRTKARLQAGKLEVMTPTADDRTAHRMRMAVDIRNTGESDARGLRVIFYGAPGMKPEDVLGETEIDIIPAGKSRRAEFAYQVKPGEENRKFRLVYEVMYKGARQRIPLQTDTPTQ